ncbi:restriction endonuclease subunit S [Calditrichota bacterium GD2]
MIFLSLSPLPEQRAIVARIEELFSRLDKGIETLKQVKQQLKVYRQAVLKWAFEGKLTAEWRTQQKAKGTLSTAEELLEKIKAERERNYQQKLDEWQKAVEEWEANGIQGKKPAKPKKQRELYMPKNDELVDLPEGWLKMPIEYICEIEDGDRGRNYPKKEDFSNDGFCIFLNAKNVTSSGFNFEQLQYISKEKHYSLRKGTLKYGDIVFTSRGTIGNTAYYSPQIKFKCMRINSGMFILREFESWLNPYYFLYGLRAPIIVQQIKKLRSGTAQPQLPIREFKSFTFTFPDKEEQQAIVQEIETRLSVADKLEQIVDESLQKAEALRHSILKKAFEGKLLSEAEREALKNDPEWEPAEKLLERIKAEKEAMEKTKQTTRKNKK